jgi:hypothetical protein
MKTKIIALLEMGLSDNLLLSLTESQIDTLYKKMGLNEQSGAVMISADKVSRDPQKVKDLTSRGINVRIEGDMTEDEEDPMDFEKGQRTQDPQQVGPGTDDGYNEYGDGMPTESQEEMSEIKKDENNPWAICHSQLGPKRNAKFERCVKQVKKSMSEGKSHASFFIEEKIVSLLERELKPKMTKADLLKQIQETQMITRSFAKSPVGKIVGNTVMDKPIGKIVSMKGETSENAPVTAPPKVRPDVKPGPRTRPAHPGKNPHPGENPAPKAKKEKLELAKKEILKAIKEILPNGKKD